MFILQAYLQFSSCQVIFHTEDRNKMRYATGDKVYIPGVNRIDLLVSGLFGGEPCKSNASYSACTDACRSIDHPSCSFWYAFLAPSSCRVSSLCFFIPQTYVQFSGCQVKSRTFFHPVQNAPVSLPKNRSMCDHVYSSVQHT